MDATPAAFLLMKVGFHGEDDLEDILKRKRADIKRHGFCLWGYGGNLCHPLRAIKPFVEVARSLVEPIPALFVLTKSPFLSQGTPAERFSLEGANWNPLPKDMNVTASTRALVLSEIRDCDRTVHLDHYTVAVGPSAGCPLPSYFRHRTDKALCIQSDRMGGEQAHRSTAPLKLRLRLHTRSSYTRNRRPAGQP